MTSALPEGLIIADPSCRQRGGIILKTNFVAKLRWQQGTAYERLFLALRASSLATALTIRSATSAAAFTWSALNWLDG